MHRGPPDSEGRARKEEPKPVWTVRPQSRAKLKQGLERTPSFQPLQQNTSSAYEQVCVGLGMLPKFAAVTREAMQACPDEANLRGLGIGDRQFTALLRDRELLPTYVIQRWRLGDNRLTGAGVKALSESLGPKCELLHLARNDIGLRGAQAIANCLVQERLLNLRFLEVSWNNLGNDAVGELCKALLKSSPVLLRFEASHNFVSEGQALGDLAAGHTQLTRLGLSHNRLCGLACAAIFRGVLANGMASMQLADVDVSWNAIGDEGASSGADAIAQVLRESSILFHLDLSYNQLDVAACAIIGEGLRDNHYLYGLHMVGNAAVVDADGFLMPRDAVANTEGGTYAPLGLQAPAQSREPCAGGLKCLADWASSRPTTAPSSGVSSCGLDVEDSVSRDGSTPPPPLALEDLPSRRASSRQRPASSPSVGSKGARLCRVPTPWTADALLRERDVLEQRTTCWACERWERVEVEWETPIGEPIPLAVWAYLSFDGFNSALRLRPSPAGSRRFVAARMVPPGCNLRVVYQVDSALRLPPGMQTDSLDEPVDIELRACEELPVLQPPSDQAVVLHETHRKKNTVEHRFVVRTSSAGIIGREQRSRPLRTDPSGQRIVLLSDHSNGSILQMPRMTETEFRMQTKITPKLSALTYWRRDRKRVLQDCLRLDWSRAKISRVVPRAAQEAVYRVLDSEYGKVVSLYRRLSAVNASENAGFSVGPLEACDIMVAAGIVDGDATRRSDVDRFFIAAQVVFSDEQHGGACEGITSHGIIRHQFLELILRIAQHRFSRRDEATWADAVKRTLQLLSTVCYKDFAETDEFIDLLHTHASDAVYKRYWNFLSGIFQRFTSRQSGAKVKHLTLSEFMLALEAMGAYDGEFHPRHAPYVFRLGMATQAEELQSNRYKEMSFTEFCHALGVVVSMRCGFTADKIGSLLESFLSYHLQASRRSPRVASKSLSTGYDA